MTRSNESPYSLKSTKKAMRAEVKSQGISVAGLGKYVHAKNNSLHLTELKNIANPNPALVNYLHNKVEKRIIRETEPSTRRNPGRMDGDLWRGDSFICPSRVDGAPVEADAGENAADEHESTEHGAPQSRAHEVSLMDIAKPAKGKRKRAVRQFDVVVPHLRGVITLDDYEDAQSEAWDIDGFSGSQVDELCSNFDEISSNFDEINSNFDGSELFEDDEDWDEFLHRAVPVGKSYSQVLRGG